MLRLVHGEVVVAFHEHRRRSAAGAALDHALVEAHRRPPLGVELDRGGERLPTVGTRGCQHGVFNRHVGFIGHGPHP